MEVRSVPLWIFLLELLTRSRSIRLGKIEAPIAVPIGQARRVHDRVIGIAVTVQINVALGRFGHEESESVPKARTHGV